MRILPILLILALATATAGVDISEILGKKLEVKNEENKNEKLISDTLSKFTERLKDKNEISLIDKTGKAQIKQTSRNWTINATIENHPIRKIQLNNVRGKNNTLKIDTPIIKDSRQSYAIDPTEINFTNGEIEVIAKGEHLFKCPGWNYTTAICEETCKLNNDQEEVCLEWFYQKEITPGQPYTIEIAPNDPAFYETSASSDVSASPYNSTTILIAFTDVTQTDVGFKIMDTNGTEIVNTTLVDTTVDTRSRVDSAWINSTHFVIFWADTLENDGTFQIWNFNGTHATSATTPIDADTSMGGINVDVSIAMLNDRFVTCYANDGDSDADFRAFDFLGTQVVGETAVDGNILPSAPLQNQIDCSATSNNRWTYFTYDDATVNDATYYIQSETGASIVGAVDIDTDVGEEGQVTVIGLNENLSGLVWYDSTDQDITIAGVNNSGTTIFGPTDADTEAGTSSRVAATGLRQDKTSTDQLFAFAWYDSADTTIKAAVYRTNGTQFTAPFNVTTTPNSTYQIIDITGRDSITGQEICPGTFIVAFSNSTGRGEFLGFWANSTPWNGTCVENEPPSIKNATVVPSIVNIGNNVCFILNVTDADGITNVTAIIDPPLGANQTLTLNEGLSCNSIPGDNLWTNIYFPIIDATHIWGTVNITDGLGVTTTHAINVSFDVLLPSISIEGIYPPTFAAYNDGTNFNVSLINVSDNVYTTQTIPANVNTRTFFNWTQFNLTDKQIKNAVIIVEHSYSNSTNLNISLDQFNGSEWISRCTLSASQTDTTHFCNITVFVNSTTLNNLQLRLNASATSNRTQNVDYIVLNLTTNTPPTINHDINQTYLLNQTALLRLNVTDLENDTIIRVNATVTSPSGATLFYNFTNTNGTLWDATHADMKLKGIYNITIRATDNQGSTRVIQTFFTRRAFNVVDIIEPKEEGVPTLQNFSFHNYTAQIISNQSNILALSINLTGAEVKQINITGYNESSPYSIIELKDDEENTPKTVSFTGYQINPEGLDFTNATLLLNASGNHSLWKCANYNFTEEKCFEGNWIEHRNITKGQLYTVNINATDPAFIETTAAGDVAMDPLNNTIFLIGFVDIAQTEVSFEILNTNGTIIINTTDVDTTVTTNARVDVNWINSSHFVIFWADTNDNDATFQIFSFNGTATTSVAGPIDVDTSMGSANVDVSLAMLDNRFVTCYANDADSDADFQAYNFAGTQVVVETAVDGNIQPSSPLQNLIDCSATNNTRWTYFTFDDSTVNDATYYILDNTGGTIVGATDIDTDVGETGQVAVIGLNNNLSGLVWYDSTDQDISIAGVNNSGTTTFGPTDVDTGAGTESRVAGAAVRQNKTSTDQLFAFAWWSQSNGTVKASIYRTNGTQFTAPFNVSASINSTFPIIDITGRDNITGQEICPGAFLVAFSNGSTGQFVGYWVNGTPWNGTCPIDLIATQLNASDLNPDELENVTFNGSIFNNGTSTAFNFISAIVDGNCTTGTMIQNRTVNLSAGQNTTLNFSWSATPVGPHNISFCVNYINNVLEDNYTNNNITITINVKAYNDYFGNITGNLTLDTNTNNTEYDWRFNDSGNIIFTNSQVTVNFTALYALGRNTTGGIAVNDFLEADQALNMTGFNDSIQTLWSTNASQPRQTTNFTVRGRTIENVPYINSTNTSNFITGILWQSVNSTSREFNATQKQPLLFVTMINRNQTGFYGRYDYEAHVPVLLRSYNSTSNALQYFVELK